ncbi:hypothetical protein [Roseburia sp. 1XD42-69]|uniref:hypothetical protein n=1 Tax=Roseburia sp. 1XD42-69 TaxID=2320088 RepID=UPI000EA129E6|nr:hypothetical protein [Roseburia sp. 1XD42-69]RKJ61107.1 hypothetical protein D7Y06_21620 [Roseburia sp. 1XD42-69]
MYFDFKIIECADGIEIIDRRQKTYYSQITPCEMVEYMEMDVQLAIIDRMKRRERATIEHKRKLARNPLWRLACICGLV